ncbi:MAG TPA: cupin domain-containing protein [Alphaproteobacteria bacterium]|nr:cupin domain-containing protein [Alphaproteobacteria bacterium]
MPASALFVTAPCTIRVANDNDQLPVKVHHLPPLTQAGARRSGPDGMVLFVEEGIVEFMVGGASGFVTAGGFVRVPADTLYAFRNAGDETARVVARACRKDEGTHSAA